MLKGELTGRWINLKNHIKQLLTKISENNFEVLKAGLSHFMQAINSSEKANIKPQDIQIENYHYESHRTDDSPVTRDKDSDPHQVSYGYTENSEFAKEAEKSEAIGIDKFGDEKDTFDFEEADDYQDFRNRNQNSDLDKRFFTRGLHK